MFVVDRLLLSPFTGLMWIMKELHKAVQAEQENEGDRLTARLSELYMLLETGQLTQEQFQAEEQAVLDRLDQLQAADQADDAESDDEDGDEDSDDEDSDQADADDDAVSTGLNQAELAAPPSNP